MNSLQLVSLKIDETHIFFKTGKNYIVGANASGKTIIFNSIKYALGLTKSMADRQVSSVELVVFINRCEFKFKRNVDSRELSVLHNSEEFLFFVRSKEHDNFLKDAFLPSYVYDGEFESVITLLDFCFLSEAGSVNRRDQWESINAICGINSSLLGSAERSLVALKKEVSKNKKLEEVVDEFSRSLLSRLSKNSPPTNIDELIEEAKADFFGEYKEQERSLVDATLKFEQIKNESDDELKSKISRIERVFIDLVRSAGLLINLFSGLESFIKGRSKAISYSEEILSRFMLVIAVAKISQEGGYNFPNVIVNDSYLSLDLHETSYIATERLLSNLISSNKNLQYIEFTYREDVQKEFVVLNLNDKGRINVFGS